MEKFHVRNDDKFISFFGSRGDIFYQVLLDHYECVDDFEFLKDFDLLEIFGNENERFITLPPYDYDIFIKEQKLIRSKPINIFEVQNNAKLFHYVIKDDCLLLYNVSNVYGTPSDVFFKKYLKPYELALPGFEFLIGKVDIEKYKKEIDSIHDYYFDKIIEIDSDDELLNEKMNLLKTEGYYPDMWEKYK